jgi:predicted O-linked N-acetylglucosamine transferase (SPINDLY family)
MNKDQLFINTFYQKIQTPNCDVSKEILRIKSFYKKHLTLQYMLGVYYEQCNRIEDAIKQFELCISLEPLFTNPYFHIANYIVKNMTDSYTIVTLLTPLINKSTYQHQSKSYKYYLKDQIQICAFLSTCQDKTQHLALLQKAYNGILSRIKQLNLSQLDIATTTGLKNVYMQYGTLMLDIDADKAVEIFYDGLCFAQTHAMNKDMLEMFLISSHYSLKQLKLPYNPSDIIISNRYMHTRIKDSDSKINLGYISPDFNKNAVGLFITAQLKHFDHSRFNVFCYYNNDKSDVFTATFRSYPHIQWVNIKFMSDQDVYKLMTMTHQLDILVDLISMGIGNRLNLIALKPAPIIINYVGFPGYSHVRAIDWRIVDHITDPVECEALHKTYAYAEKLYRLPRCFLCYHMFDNVLTPPVKPKFGDRVRLGVTSRFTKVHPELVSIWASILHENPQITLCIKADGTKTCSWLDKFPINQIEYIPFQEELDDFLNLHNTFDFCLDTFPYSGTTTTCSALLMGVPVITYYDRKNPHVSNTSASILKHCHLDEFVCSSLESYKDKIRHLCIDCERYRSHEFRCHVRHAFETLMNPIEFMKHYESLLIDVYNKYMY